MARACKNSHGSGYDPTDSHGMVFLAGDMARSSMVGESVMAVDGTWNLTMQTPMGERKSLVTLVANGGTLMGEQSAEGNTGAIFDGSVSGNDVTWKISITDPMPLTLEFNGTVTGDAMSGSMSAGLLGSWSFSGSRG